MYHLTCFMKREQKLKEKQEAAEVKKRQIKALPSTMWHLLLRWRLFLTSKDTEHLRTQIHNKTFRAICSLQWNDFYF